MEEEQIHFIHFDFSSLLFSSLCFASPREARFRKMASLPNLGGLAFCIGIGHSESSLRSNYARCVSRRSGNGFSFSSHGLRKGQVVGIRPLRMLSSGAATAPEVETMKLTITLTEKALKHLQKMKAELNQDLCLRIGVRQGGCSGMSYTMDFEHRAHVRSDDSVIDYEGFTMVCDPKSLLFLYGMQLDYSDALIGGGFTFSNPNATSTCGCGKSFAA
eukprot:c27896_g2_i1 orf=623-1273(-)